VLLSKDQHVVEYELDAVGLRLPLLVFAMFVLVHVVEYTKREIRELTIFLAQKNECLFS
jgi:hypothetical protein